MKSRYADPLTEKTEKRNVSQERASRGTEKRKRVIFRHKHQGEFSQSVAVKLVGALREIWRVSRKTIVSPSNGIFPSSIHFWAILSVANRRPSRSSHIRSPSFQGHFFHFPSFLYAVAPAGKGGPGKVSPITCATVRRA